jgi:hypothetical protein
MVMCIVVGVIVLGITIPLFFNRKTIYHHVFKKAKTQINKYVGNTPSYKLLTENNLNLFENKKIGNEYANTLLKYFKDGSFDAKIEKITFMPLYINISFTGINSTILEFLSERKKEVAKLIGQKNHSAYYKNEILEIEIPLEKTGSVSMKDLLSKEKEIRKQSALLGINTNYENE